MPSTIATRPGPCDSPAVVKRKRVLMPRLGYLRAAARIASSGASRPVQIRKREGALPDEDLDSVDDGRPGGLGRGQQPARLLAVDEVDDGLPGGEAAGDRAAARRRGPRRAGRRRWC